MIDVKYCPICGSEDLTYSDLEHHYFKCNKCEKWMGTAEYPYWEIQYIIQKVQALRKAMEKLEEEKKNDL